MGKRTFIILVIASLLFMVGISLLPIGASLKESLWVAREMWFREAPPSTSSLAKTSLEIGYDDYRTLGNSRVDALDTGVLLDSLQEYVAATFIYEGVERNAAVKLKGMRPTHWRHPISWSFRVVVLKGEELIDGVKIFSLQTPEQRGYYVDALYHDFLDKLDVVNLKYNFVHLQLNGMDLGPYMNEEFFDAPVLQRLNKPNGPIIRFDYESFWAGLDWKDPQLSGLRDSLAATYHTAPIKSYKFPSGTYKDWEKDSEEGLALLDGFRNQELRVGEVFDIPSFARYFAVNTLFGNQHSALLTNLRFYYNPELKRLEPVGYDIEGIYSLERDTNFEFCYWPSGNTENRTEFVAQVFADTSFYSEYKRVMNVVSDSTFIKPILSGFQPTFDELAELYPRLEDRRSLIWENAGAFRRHFGVESPEK